MCILAWGRTLRADEIPPQPWLRWDTLGLRYGFSATSISDGFQQGEVTAHWLMPWHFRVGKSWIVQTGIEASAGVLTGRTEEGFVGTCGPRFLLGPAGTHFHLDLGVAPTLLGRDEFDDVNFGVVFQFTSHAGVAWDISRRCGVGYRFQHMSNAGISDNNPGLDLHSIGFSFRF